MSELPPLPVFNIAAVNTLRDKLIDEVFLQRYHVTPEGAEFESLLRALQSALPRQIPRDALFESCRPVTGIELTPPVCQEFAWRLAGNLQRLRGGQAVQPWSVQRVPEWVPLQILRMAHGRNHFDEPGYFVDFRALAGTPCPLVLTRFWSGKYCGYVSGVLGFSAPWHKYPYQDAHQLVSLRLVGLVKPEYSSRKPSFRDIGHPGWCIQWNRQVLKLRHRVIPCPRGWFHACHQCAIGYVECDGATHRENYVQAFCETCGNMSYFDPEAAADRCVVCDKQHRLKRSATDGDHAQRPGIAPR